ncbi:MAG TPA: GH3 auxin-responsive promoter family protein [Bacteroidales bacterium]|nr:GH3 auxin-responsive promoter family protein [Bacteroidales bacterium]
MVLINSLLGLINYNRLIQIDYFRKNPVEVQESVLQKLVETAAGTEFGLKYNFAEIKSYEQFCRNIPIQDYDTLKPYIESVMNGNQNVLWPTEIRWFAKSSGTTSDRSKYIPISNESLEDCHFRSGKDIFLLYADRFPETMVFMGKSLAIGGSTNINLNSENSYYGDLSAVLIKNLPFWTYFHRIPKEDIALIEEWDEKLDKIVESTYNKNVTNIVGVPSWLLVLLKKILLYTGKNNILEVWPNLELFIHGGVSFLPYKNSYEKIIPSSAMTYLETYNASEGFFGIQDETSSGEQNNDQGLLLMLDYGIFYEFIELNDYLNGKTNTVPLSEVKTGVNYAMIISTNGGLWRYVIGDTVSFTSKNPYKIKITGRTKHYINAFGEEVIIDNVQNALLHVCELTGAQIREYTAAPVFYHSGKSQGAHQWLFEFIKAPENIEFFKEELDRKLRTINSDYDAKRFKDITLGIPEIVVLKEGVFYKWLREKGKLGGQHKVPRLSNTRDYVEELLKINDLMKNFHQ